MVLEAELGILVSIAGELSAAGLWRTAAKLHGPVLGGGFRQPSSRPRVDGLTTELHGHADRTAA
jgi:hypothetical protein